MYVECAGSELHYYIDPLLKYSYPYRTTLMSPDVWNKILQYCAPIVTILPNSLGLPSQFVQRAWRKQISNDLASIIKFAEDFLAGKPTPIIIEGEGIHVMGGDFIVNSSGKLVFAYRMKDGIPKDRPLLEKTLNALESTLVLFLKPVVKIL